MVLTHAHLRRGATVILLATVLAGLMPATEAQAVDRRKAHVLADRVETLINRTRARHGVRKLRVHVQAARRSRSHAHAMKRRGTVFHDSALSREMPKAARAWGENVGMSSARRAPMQLHRMLMRSPGHRANILRHGYTDMAIGVAKGKRYTYLVQRFIER